MNCYKFYDAEYVIQKDFKQWKKEAKENVNKMKKDKPTVDEVYNWLVENK